MHLHLHLLVHSHFSTCTFTLMALLALLALLDWSAEVCWRTWGLLPPRAVRDLGLSVVKPLQVVAEVVK